MKNSIINKQTPYLIIIASLLILSFLPAIHEVYAFHDDLICWIYPHKLPEAYFTQCFYSGRCLGAVIFKFYFSHINNIADLNIVRLTSVLIIIGCAISCFGFLSKYFSRSFDAALVSVIIFSLPAFEVMADWASCCYHPYALIFVMASISMVCRIPLYGSLMQRIKNPTTLISIGLVLCSYLVYPPIAAFYWAMAALVLIIDSQKNDWASYKSRASNIYFVGLLGIGLYFGILKALGQFIHYNYSSSYRPQDTVSDISGKFSWFFQKVIPQIMNLWNIFPGKILPTAITILIAGAIILNFYKTSCRNKQPVPCAKMALNIFIILNFCILSYLPSLATSVNLDVYRCTAGIMTLLVISIIWAIKNYCDCLPKSVNSALFTMALSLICFYGVWHSYFNIDKFRAKPSHLEYTFIKNAIQRFNGKFDTILIIQPNNDEFYHSNDEFGTLNSRWPGNVLNLLNCIFNDMAAENGLKWVGIEYVDKILCYSFEDKAHHIFLLKIYFDIVGQMPSHVSKSVIVINMRDLYPSLKNIMGKYWNFKRY